MWTRILSAVHFWKLLQLSSALVNWAWFCPILDSVSSHMYSPHVSSLFLRNLSNSFSWLWRMCMCKYMCPTCGTVYMYILSDNFRLYNWCNNTGWQSDSSGEKVQYVTCLSVVDHDVSWQNWQIYLHYVFMVDLEVNTTGTVSISFSYSPAKMKWEMEQDLLYCNH